MTENTLIASMRANGLLSDYFSLKEVLKAAIDQAESGKGKERHAEDGEPFERQIICEVARRVGLGYPLGQAVKKVYESQRLGGTAGLDELLGAINYIAAAYIVMQERVKDGNAKCEEEGGPEYKPGDKVLAKSPSTGAFIPAEYVQPHPSGCGHVVRNESFGRFAVDLDAVMPVPKAEGCEDLVFDEARMRESMPGIVPQDGPSDLDGEPAIYGAHIE